MANIFAPNGQELALKKDINIITGNNSKNSNALATTTSLWGFRGSSDIKDAPDDAWGTLDTRIAVVLNGGTSYYRGGQFYMADNNKLFYHAYTNNAGGYKPWQEIAMQSQIDALQNQINDLKKQIGGALSSALTTYS